VPQQWGHGHYLMIMILRWFSDVERLDERRLTKEIYEADLDGNATTRRSRRTFFEQIE
jgi:hypothetical protein